MKYDLRKYTDDSALFEQKIYEIQDLSGFQNLTGLPKGRILINDEQYFDNIPLTAWEFYIGGYQPAQNWFKDRRNRQLSFEDILYY